MGGTDADVVVVGGGIVGLAAARELQRRRPGARIVVLEREADLARHQTGRNSGVAHAGLYYTPGSLKATLCTAGLARLYEFCERHALPHERCGKVVVAVDRSELPRLDELERRGRANGVPGLRRVDAAGLAELEPHARGVAALHSPATGIVDFAAVARALAVELKEHGAVVRCESEVTGIRREGDRVRVDQRGGRTVARLALVCAGLRTDRLAVAAGGATDPRLVPFRGAYLRLRPEARGLVRGLIYPVGDPALPFLGVHLTRRIDGEVLLGPSALLVPTAHALAWPGTWRAVVRLRRAVGRELRLAASRRAFVADGARYVPALRVRDVTSGPSGVRAQAIGRDGGLVDDFVVGEASGAIFVRNAPSPAATSSLALADLIADRAEAALG